MDRTDVSAGSVSGMGDSFTYFQQDNRTEN